MIELREMQRFQQELEVLMRRYELDRVSGTPVDILANHLCGELVMFDVAVNSREEWYNRGVSDTEVGEGKNVDIT